MIYLRLVTVIILKYKFGSIYLSRKKIKLDLNLIPDFLYCLHPEQFCVFCDILHLILVSLKTLVNFQSEILNVVYQHCHWSLTVLKINGELITVLKIKKAVRSRECRTANWCDWSSAQNSVCGTWISPSRNEKQVTFPFLFSIIMLFC